VVIILELFADLRFEHESRLRALLEEAKSSTLDLADLLLGISAREHGCDTTLTFDRRASRSELFTLL
jgi:predicted nucleic acid-binding protein